MFIKSSKINFKQNFKKDVFAFEVEINPCGH